MLNLFVQGSLDYPFWGDQTMQMYGNLQGFLLIVHYKELLKDTIS